jgi:DNA invertase Pin-like site-specific DNA recombinase
MNSRQPGNTKITALYSRFSVDDDVAAESGSTSNQKAILDDYAAKNGFVNTVHFSDDGFSGKNFERPDWKRLMSEVENGNIGTLILKDMSRFGRDHVQVGMCMELFRQCGVRFIAIGNSIDSINPDTLEFVPFINIMSEWYLRDASRKVKASHKIQGMSGKRLTFTPIYGYMLDPNDKTKWVPDPEAAEIVRRIYRLTTEGKGSVQIARILAEEKIERPSYYLNSRGIVNYSGSHDMTMPYAWSGNSVARMISKPEYMGHTVNFRTSMESYKDKRAKENPKEEWVIFENTHPAVIDPDTWETAQRCRKTVRRTDSHGEANPLTGLVLCADCGAKLYNHRQPYPKQYKNKAGYNCTRSPRDFYSCSTYNLTGRHYNHQCTNHQIRTVVLRELALDTIKSVSGFVRTNEAEFIKQIRETSAVQQEEAARAHRKRIAKEEKRIVELNTLIRRIYEDNVSGKLTDKRFEVLSREYEQEQSDLEQSVTKLQSEIDSFNADSVRADRFIDIVKRYTDFTELTAPMIMEFIEKIVVHEGDKSSGERQQQVDIYLNFIGKFELPAPEPTPEETEAEEQAREKRERHREAQRRYYAKQKLQTAEGI